MTPAEKKAIDKASYEEMLREWRFADANLPKFTGDAGVYFFKSMTEKRNKYEDKGEAISQKVGLTNPLYIVAEEKPVKKVRAKK